LYFYMSRFFDPALGRFVSPDSIVPGAGDPQAYDRYAYVFNNPVNATDPTGHIACIDGEQCFNQRSPVVYFSSSASGKGNKPIVALINNGNAGLESNSENNSTGKDDDIPSNLTILENNDGGLSTASKSCPFGWISAVATPDGSCGHAVVNGNAIIDPLAWEHIAAATLGGIATISFGAGVMIPLGADLCVTVAGCFAGGSLVIGGVGAILGGSVLVWGGYKFTQKYLDDIFIIEP